MLSGQFSFTLLQFTVPSKQSIQINPLFIRTLFRPGFLSSILRLLFVLVDFFEFFLSLLHLLLLLLLLRLELLGLRLRLQRRRCLDDRRRSPVNNRGRPTRRRANYLGPGGNTNPLLFALLRESSDCKVSRMAGSSRHRLAIKQGVGYITPNNRLISTVPQQKRKEI